MDNELEAMQAVHAALVDLEDAARQRVLAWAASKFEIQGIIANGTGRGGGKDASDDGEGGPPLGYSDIGELVDAAQPDDGPSRALVVAYWFQEIEGREGWAGADVNNALKNLGHPLANVTKTLTSLRGRRPSLVMQIGKSGRSAQARKTYKLTAAGVREVKQMIARGSDVE